MIKVFFLVLALAAATYQQNVTIYQSPCPGIFRYEPLGSEPNRWYGIVKLYSETTLHSVWLNILLDGKANFIGNWVGNVTSKDNMDFRIANTGMKLTAGTPVPLRFFVQHFAGSTPKLVAIRLNGKEICSAQKSPTNTSGEAITRISLDTPTTSELDPVSSAPNIQVQCGEVVLNRPKRVVNGKPTLVGQWPWQVAIYQTRKLKGRFICGGTLISPKHVVTAAHCVFRRGTSESVNTNSYTVYLGKHNLETFTDATQIKYLEKIIFNEEFNATSFYRDVAILELKDPVKYTDWVRPACLWPENMASISNVIGKQGSVVGWGLDATGKPTKELTLAELSVVDSETCISSYQQFFMRYVNDYAYCAGSGDGTAVCNYDSGGGMVFQIDNFWYLRGIVSVMVAKKDDYVTICDPTHFAIFADVAKFLPWIKSIIGE